jgi:hypothetical protein
MANLSYIPSFYFYRFADAVSGPYTALNAYSSGIIDRNGNIKGNESSIDPFEYFVIKLKRIFDQLPPGTTKYKLQNLMGTLQVFNEEFDLPEISKEQLNSLIESHIMINAEDGVSYLNLLEDMSTGSAGGGAGTIGTPAEAPGANKGNVSGYDPVMMPMMSRSGPVNMFPSIEMFNVPKSEFDAFKAAKAWKQLQDSKTKRYLQRFQRRNKNGKMAVRDEESGEIFFIPYNEKSLVEELNLKGLDILNEQKGDQHFNVAATAVLEPFDDESIEKIRTGKINKTNAEQYGRAATFFASLGNLTQKITEPFLDQTIKTSKKSVDSTSEDGVGVDEDGRLFVANFKNHRATYGTRGVEQIGFPETLVKGYYDLKKEKDQTQNQREVSKIKAEMKKLGGQAREWSEPASRQKAIAGLIKKHLDKLREPTVAVTPYEEPFVIPHEGVVKHIMKQPVRVVLGLTGQGGRPEPQAQLGGSELARSRSGLETLKRNIEIQPRHVIPDEGDIKVAKDVLDPSLFLKFMKVFKPR